MSHTTYLRRIAAAEYLREQRRIPCSEKTLAKLACIGGGPVYPLFGPIPLYASLTSTPTPTPSSASWSARPPNTEAMIMRSSGAKTPRFFTRMQIADGRGEWVLLKSASCSDQFLFDMLKLGWPTFVPFAEARRFALIYCWSGPNSGIWLHYLATPALCAEYLPGCHKIVSWV